MSNAARQLHQLLTIWQATSTDSIYKARSGDANDPEFWRRQGQAVSLLLEVEQLLAGLAETGMTTRAVYERYLPTWYRAVFAPEHLWSGAKPHHAQNNNTIIDQQALDMLAALADVIGDVSLPDLSEETVEEIARTLEEAAELVRGTPDLPRAEKVYLLALIREGLSVVEEVEVLGTARVRRFTIELVGAMVRASYQSTDDDFRSKLHSFTMRLLGFTGRTAAGRAIEVGVEGALGIGQSLA